MQLQKYNICLNFKISITKYIKHVMCVTLLTSVLNNIKNCK